MNRDQMILAKSKGKLPFKVIKNDKVKFSLGESFEQTQSKFKDWTIIQISWDEFESNYKFFTVMNVKQILKDLSSVHINIQKITIGVADIYGQHELVIEETGHSFKTVSFGKLGGISESFYPKPEFNFKRTSEFGYDSLYELMNHPFKFKDFVDSI
jgi:hypothetical protein